ncbi:MAG: hypothetical protein IAE77_20900 [Prosthecobacter sp.]|jgi:hypothetical protein|uniref:hypothetical protein n=1 Tax=Prosthecobacter sp. TaxID=1965333 RepID=UPI0019E36C07|nr:hypothetical protein [Prosthecobacter sp.]MBE2285928.1 hypothetical protein [Prosthecobacter sp.]
MILECPAETHLRQGFPREVDQEQAAASLSAVVEAWHADLKTATGRTTLNLTALAEEGLHTAWDHLWRKPRAPGVVAEGDKE